LGKKGSRRAICASVSQKRSDMVTARFRAVNHTDSRKSMGPDPKHYQRILKILQQTDRIMKTIEINL
ncbi:hypothetical protein, partial [Cribrihabitans pelagius]|uniref:hypothetical protein n=1 Tax=Cribrihabitans pelagius TaxID=1765746 RepID=UPI003B597BA8